jgi:very-short-patch-repair endonuclease
VDFLYEAERVVIECDGRRHHFGKIDAERDRWRDLDLSAAGWLVIRVTWWQLVHQPERFTAQLRRVLDRRREPEPA